ncbi:hypothetical protein ABIA22_000407 [Sinorhizobium fredii]|uniref:hypothetical protein n=1 Tax=Rhizobium fredii TaxID=380 RepID=UPI003515D5CE
MMTRSKSNALFALLILPALSGCNFVASFFESEFVTACEASLQERLRSPSEYKRIKITSYEEKLDRAALTKYLSDERVGDIFLNAELRDFDRGNLNPTLFGLLISYDAPNVFGTPIRRTARCEYIDARGDDSAANEHNVKVDGKTYTDWLIEAVRASSN